MSVGRLVARFTLAGLVALMALAVATAWVSRRVGTREAMADARRTAWISGKGIVEPALEPGLRQGDAIALRHLDETVRANVLRGSLMRVKVWQEDGTILYSDDARLIGDRFTLDDSERELLRGRGGTHADVSDLSKPENQFEAPSTKLLEVYSALTGPGGEPLLFEAYFRYDGVIDAGRSVWLNFAPVALGALVLLEAVQVPFAWSLARRLRRNQHQRELLLQRAVDASDNERRRIARDLHDGVVQELTGVSYLLAARSRAAGQVDAQIDEAAMCIRESVKSLRSMLVDIYPPNLAEEGLEAAIGDLVAGLANRGVQVDLDIDVGDVPLEGPELALLYRAAQEAVRNVVAHAEARHVRVVARAGGGRASVRVDDDGRGFDPTSAGAVTEDGHVGLRVLADLVAEAGGTVTIASAPGRGTEVAVEVPLR